MIKHIVLFRFADGVPLQQQQELVDELNRLPEEFEDMQRWSLGVNRSSRDDRFTHGFVVEFDDEEKLERYLHSERHESFVRERFRPIIEERAIVSYEFTM